MKYSYQFQKIRAAANEAAILGWVFRTQIPRDLDDHPADGPMANGTGGLLPRSGDR
jgi:hypothetical protein